jgi:hypothetical protein
MEPKTSDSNSRRKSPESLNKSKTTVPEKSRTFHELIDAVKCEEEFIGSSFAVGVRKISAGSPARGNSDDNLKITQKVEVAFENDVEIKNSHPDSERDEAEITKEEVGNGYLDEKVDTEENSGFIQLDHVDEVEKVGEEMFVGELAENSGDEAFVCGDGTAKEIEGDIEKTETVKGFSGWDKIENKVVDENEYAGTKVEGTGKALVGTTDVKMDLHLAKELEIIQDVETDDASDDGKANDGQPNGDDSAGVATDAEGQVEKTLVADMEIFDRNNIALIEGPVELAVQDVAESTINCDDTNKRELPTKVEAHGEVEQNQAEMEANVDGGVEKINGSDTYDQMIIEVELLQQHDDVKGEASRDEEDGGVARFDYEIVKSSKSSDADVVESEFTDAAISVDSEAPKLAKSEALKDEKETEEELKSELICIVEEVLGTYHAVEEGGNNTADALFANAEDELIGKTKQTIVGLETTDDRQTIKGNHFVAFLHIITSILTNFHRPRSRTKACIGYQPGRHGRTRYLPTRKHSSNHHNQRAIHLDCRGSFADGRYSLRCRQYNRTKERQCRRSM